MLVGGAPTLDVASVRLFKVVLLPDDGLPTRAIRGSRGIARCEEGLCDDGIGYAQCSGDLGRVHTSTMSSADCRAQIVLSVHVCGSFGLAKIANLRSASVKKSRVEGAHELPGGSSAAALQDTLL